jgi:hypothetical protein
MIITNSIANDRLTFVSRNLTLLNEVDTNVRPKWQFTDPTSISLALASSGLGSQTYLESKSLARFCCEFLNLQHLAKSAFTKSVVPIEAQMRQVLHPGYYKSTWAASLDTSRTHQRRTLVPLNVPAEVMRAEDIASTLRDIVGAGKIRPNPRGETISSEQENLNV